MSYYQNLRDQIKNAKKLIGISLETKDGGTPLGMEQFSDSIKTITRLVTEQGEVIVKNAKAYEELRETNDRRLKELEQRGSSDVLDTEKLDRINDELNQIAGLKEAMNGIKTDLEELAVKMNRPDSGGSSETQFSRRHKTAFDRYARTADETDLRSLDTKDSPMLISSPADGGFAVPEHLDRTIMKLVRDDSVLRALANVVKVGTSDYKKLINKGGTSSGWVGETDPRTETDPSKIAEISPIVGEIYAYPGASQNSLDDIYFDVEDFILDEVYDEFADQEDLAAFGGDGIKKPKGLLTAPMSTAPDKTRPFGTVQKYATGNNANITADSIMRLPYTMKAKHRNRAVWLMNSITMGEIRLLKNNAGDYLWREGLEDGKPNTLNGHPVRAAENMPDIAAGTTPIALGNWKKAYTIVDRSNIRLLRNPFNVVGYVYFYLTKRVGGHYMDTQAYKLISVE